MCFGSAVVTSSEGVLIFPNDGQFQRFVSRNIKMLSIPQSIPIPGTFGSGYQAAMSYPLFLHCEYLVCKGVSLIGFCP